ncbi:hypothetical protein ILUMI_15637 [Ignelater luminosus]|uniref:PiggyBac transposable element-derived protein domain-containing protein n=1 Tax=Ignelater luminosus TaxID=2038154 RepID=A0A8K0G9B8_IGNLU|nr:hypothetical protein ILUMI_15637 [Ignelater luminosus]
MQIKFDFLFYMQYLHKTYPKHMAPDKSLKRGDSDYRHCTMDIGVWKWKDNRVLRFASNYHGSELTSIKHTQKDGSKREIPALLVKDYKYFMGGVDHADRLRFRQKIKTMVAQIVLGSNSYTFV